MRILLIATLFSISATGPSLAGDLFADPGQTCLALSHKGLTRGKWVESRNYPGRWVCPGEVAVLVGTDPERAGLIQIRLNVITDRGTRHEWGKIKSFDHAFHELGRLTKQLFDNKEVPVPDELSHALDEGRDAVISTEFGRAYVIKQSRSKEDRFVELRLVSHEALDSAQRAQGASDQEVLLCRDAVIAATDYDRDALVADPEPVERPGFRAYMFAGNRDDLYICEVRDGGHYAIKAALSVGAEPTIIDEGTFE